MSFDALLTIVFILFFVLGPLIRRLGGGQGRQSPPDRKPPVVPPAGSEEHRREASTTRESGGGDPAEGGLSERLEEARRRVLEAMGEETAQSGGRREGNRATGGRSERSGGPREAPPNTMGRQAGRAPLDWQPAPSTGSDRPPLDWQAEATTSSTRPPLDWQSSASQGGGKSSGLDWQELVTPAESFIPRVERRRRRSTRISVSDTETAAPQVRTERRDKRAGAARLSDGRVLALGRGGILRGLIWHEILSEPVSKRGTRRQSSRLRSR